MLVTFTQGFLLFIVYLVGLHDLLYQRVTYHVLGGELADLNPFDSLHNLQCDIQSAGGTGGQILLTGVSCNDRLGTKADTGEEHFHLGCGGILRFVQDDEGIVKGTPSHVSKRGNLNESLFHIFVNCSPPMMS